MKLPQGIFYYSLLYRVFVSKLPHKLLRLTPTSYSNWPRIWNKNYPLLLVLSAGFKRVLIVGYKSKVLGRIYIWTDKTDSARARA